MKNITISLVGCFFTLIINAQSNYPNQTNFEEELKKEGVIFGSEKILEVKHRGANKLVVSIDKSQENTTGIFNEDNNREHLDTILSLLKKVKAIGIKTNVLESFSNSAFYMGFKNSDCDIGPLNIIRMYQENWLLSSSRIESLNEIFSNQKIDEINNSIVAVKEISSKINKRLIENTPSEFSTILDYICGDSGAIPYNSMSMKELNKAIKTLENLIIAHLAYLKIVTLK